MSLDTARLLRTLGDIAIRLLTIPGLDSGRAALRERHAATDTVRSAGGSGGSRGGHSDPTAGAVAGGGSGLTRSERLDETLEKWDLWLDGAFWRVAHLAGATTVDLGPLARIRKLNRLVRWAETLDPTTLDAHGARDLATAVDLLWQLDVAVADVLRPPKRPEVIEHRPDPTTTACRSCARVGADVPAYQRRASKGSDTWRMPYPGLCRFCGEWPKGTPPLGVVRVLNERRAVGRRITEADIAAATRKRKAS